MEIECFEWCKHHNVKLVEVQEYGFVYMLPNGDKWWMSFSDMYY